MLARGGNVHTVAVAEGLLSGRVDADGVEHAVEIAAEPVPPRIWAAASRSARGNPQIEAAVAGRGQSVQLEHELAVDWEEPLVPATQALGRSCTCGRPACEHVAALAYVVADRIDREPSLLLRWRGCTEPVAPPAAEPEPEPIVATDEIWEAAPPPELGPPRPLPTAAVLKRLGPSGIQVGGRTSPRCSSAPTPRSPRPLDGVRRSGFRRQRFDRDDLERADVRGAEHDRRRDARLVRLEPARGADAPAVAGPSPSKPHSGRGVERSFPAARLKTRNSSVTTAQTVWLPTSSGPVAQQPSRKKPVSGAVEQGSSSPPTTFGSGSRPGGVTSRSACSPSGTGPRRARRC